MNAILVATLLLTAPARFAYPPQIEGAQVETYKTVGGTSLKLYILAPPGTKNTAPKNAPAIVFFFGGGWSSGTPQQFEHACRYLASRGMVGITADYRVASRQHVKPNQCVADARSAIRWVRAHAAQLGIDPQRIAAGGGSAGGHLAACTPWIDACDEPGEDHAVSAAPNALVLFNPVLLLAPIDGLQLEGFAARVNEERMGTAPERISPAHHVQPHGPPTIIFHGRADTTVPLVTVEAFVSKMKAAGNRCELVVYDGQPHGFFNREPHLGQTTAEMDKFLRSLGWLSGDPLAADKK